MRFQLLGLRFDIGRATREIEAAQPAPAIDFSRVEAWDFALRRVRLLRGGSIEDFLRAEGHDPEDFERVTLAAEGYRTETSETALVYAALEELALVALAHGCEYAVDPQALGHSGFTSRSTSGFGLGLAGLGFGFASPDGTFSQALHLVATGLRRRSTGP